MKRLILLLSPLLLFGFLFATENNDLIQQVNDLEEKTTELDQYDLRFQTFASCEEMTTVMEKFIKEHFETRGGSWGRGGGIMMAEDSKVAVTPSNALSLPTTSPSPVVSDGVDYSTTNIQVAGVDEPEILKSDGDYLYYYNQRLQKVFIISSPLDRSTKVIDLPTVDVVATINIPGSFSNVQLFVRKDQLIILSQRRSELPQPGLVDKSNKTDVIIYDTSDITNPKLVKFADLDGVYQDARLIDDKLYVVSQLGINRRRLSQRYPKPEEIKIETNSMLPQVIDVSYVKEAQKQNLKIGDDLFPYQISLQRAGCESTFYVLPTDEAIKQYGLTPQFTVIRAIDVSRPNAPIDTTTAFGSTQTIHLTPHGLYLANPFWMGSAYRCPPGVMCIWPGGGIQDGTLLHKFTLQGTTVSYVNSALIPGSPLTQRSMSEDDKENFRILTRTWTPKIATHLITLDKGLNKLGSLLHIEPGEEFKASRFMGDKLYLVTFEQTDPLFVIDLKDLKKPTIIGELIIPGFSTYLHPYLTTGSQQRLIGLGYDTTTNQWGGTVTNGIKVDLYKIDYAQKTKEGMIAVDQIATRTFGGKGSDTEALNNPRLFVWNPTTQQLVLPMVLQNQLPGKNCTIEYDTDGKILRQQCRDSERYTTFFAGLKSISVTPQGIEERHSYDYSTLLKQDKQSYQYEDLVAGEEGAQIQPRHFTSLQFRAGYLGDVLYTLNNLFGHFVVPGQKGQEFYLPLDSSIETN